MAFERVAELAQIPSDCGLRVRMAGREVGLYRIGDRVYAMDNLCPHAGYPLHEGELDGTWVICPGHGWAFDVITGLAPGEIEEEPLERYPVRVEDGAVWIDVSAPLEKS
jgi:nitrite reductase/ring-hydroxylating ferredoxin subunit